MSSKLYWRLKLKTTTISGRVLDSNGLSVDGAQVAVVSGNRSILNHTGIQTDQDSNTCETAEDGSYDICLSEKPEALFVVAYHPDYPPYISEKIWFPYGQRTIHNITIPVAARIIAQLHNRISPQSGIQISLKPVYGADCFRALQYFNSKITDDAGCVEFDKVSPGNWMIEWLDGSIVRYSYVSVCAEKNYEVILGKPVGENSVTLSGHVTSNGSLVEGLELGLTRPFAHQLTAYTTTNKDGYFSMPGITFGEYQLQVRGVLPRFKTYHDIRIKVHENMPSLELDFSQTTLKGVVNSSDGPVSDVKIEPYCCEFSGSQSKWSFCMIPFAQCRMEVLQFTIFI